MAKRATRRPKKRAAKRRVSKKPRRGARKARRNVQKPGRRTKKSNRFHLALMKLKRMKDGQRRKALSMANDAFIRQMCTYVRRLRYARLSPAVQKKIQRQKEKLRKLIMPKTSLPVKRKMLSQRGGFLPAMLAAAIPAALPAIGSMVGNIIAGVRRRR